MTREDILDALLAHFPAEQILWRKEDIIPYAFDGTATLFQTPIAVYMAQSNSDVADMLKFCSKHALPVVSRGAGSGLSGGSVPVANGIVLCTTRLNRHLEVDAANLLLSADAGVATIKVAKAAESAGLFYPPDPGSMKVSTIGGNVAHNSGGLRGLKYGVTRDYVMGLEVVLANGEITWLGSHCVKNAAGYSLKDLFIGSEGTLGVITRVLLKLIPKPAARRTLSATFASTEAAADAVSSIIAAKVIPCTLEYLDGVTINAIEDYARIGLPRNAAALLLIEADGHPAPVAEEAALIETILHNHDALEVKSAASDEEALKLAEARRTAFSALARISPTTILEDITVPRSRLAAMVRAIHSIADKYQLRIGTFGHFGDGNLHPTFLVDERNSGEMSRVHDAMGELFAEALKLDGTITGEHGVGLAKKPYLPSQIDEPAMRLLREVKRVLDPQGILNPGKIFSWDAGYPAKPAKPHLAATTA